jgi:predicted regulator of Ras-like GTPase activity (Roadblock/LC7/MglB family)
MGSYHEVLTVLQRLRTSQFDIEGSIVATTDGMVVAHDLSGTETYGIEPEGVAALAAVNLGLSQRIADTASHGDLQETVIRGAFGLVITYAVGDRALLTVLARPTEDLTGLHALAREAAAQVAGLLTHDLRDDAATWHGMR